LIFRGSNLRPLFAIVILGWGLGILFLLNWCYFLLGRLLAPLRLSFLRLRIFI
jgi:hypothetical protein